MKAAFDRKTSFIIVTLIYALCSAAGILLFSALPFEFYLSLLIADVAATVAVFAFSLLFRNASVYDPYWSVQPMVILIATAAGGAVSASGAPVLTAVCLWGVRLTANWAYTFHGLGAQDWRYTMLAKNTGRLYPVVNFCGIHLVPTLVVYGCVLPAALTVKSGAELNAGGVIFFALSVCAAILQGVADCQMHSFKRAGQGGFIRRGLWKYSRHPNYLCEITMWWSIALFAVCTLGFRWYYIAGAAANTLLFLCVSIPLADSHQSRKEGFAEYKRQTHMLLPVKRF